MVGKLISVWRRDDVVAQIAVNEVERVVWVTVSVGQGEPQSLFFRRVKEMRDTVKTFEDFFECLCFTGSRLNPVINI